MSDKSKPATFKPVTCNQPGFTLWFTGLSGSGKTTLAKLVEKELRALGLKVERLDGDIVRQSLSRDLGFTKEDRDKNIERVTFVAKLLARNGVAVLTSFISPYRDVRARAREEIGNFIEVYCKAPLEVLIERDVKGLYTKALRGEIENFTGISDPYEEPLNPEVICETDKESPEESVAKVLAKLEESGYISEVAAEDAYSEEEGKVIEERLRALGYI
jgi:adenylylsulfate kinase